MTYSGLSSRVYNSSQKSSRNGATIDSFLIHHQASTNSESVLQMMLTGSREVSANYIITNEGQIWSVVPEEYRAWTSGSSSDGGKGAAWDRRSITVEIENESGNPDWRISTAAINAAARLYADLKKRYGVSILIGHRDLWERYRASYPTYCPGPTTVSRIASVSGGGTDLPPAGGSGGSDTTSYGFGLSGAAQEAIQGALQRLGRYTGVVDGAFGALSVRAMQQWLKDNGYLAASYGVDGIPGAIYGKALQTLAKKYGYTGPVDGAPGANTSSALINWAKTVAPGASAGTSTGGKDWSYWEPTGELAKRVQRALAARGRYSGPIDGVFGVNTRKGVQITIAKNGYSGPIDGIIEREGCYYIQTYAKRYGDYSGPVDRAPREASWTGFALGLERP